MVREEWPKVRADIDAGHLSPLGLVRVKSNDPFDLKENHQVLAYGYDQEDGALTLRLYDPNLPKRDDVTMSFSLADPNAPTPVRSFPGGPRIFAFFRVPYARSSRQRSRRCSPNAPAVVGPNTGQVRLSVPSRSRQRPVTMTARRRRRRPQRRPERPVTSPPPGGVVDLPELVEGPA